VQLGYAYHVYFCYQDYDKARAHLRIAKAGLPNSADNFLLPGYIDRMQGRFEQAAQEFRAALELDPHNPGTFLDLGLPLLGCGSSEKRPKCMTGRFLSRQINRRSKCKRS
jgi:tetratricopeptide (TPR) repeat protein